MVVLFNMLVNAYMPEYSDALGRLCPRDLYFLGPLYQYIFFFIGTNITFNIFTAFTIDVFTTLKADQDSGEKTEEERNLQSMRKALKEQGWVLYARMPAEVLRTRIQRKVYPDLEDVIKNAREEAEKEIQRRAEGVDGADEA